LLGDLGEADFTERIMDFSQAIRNGGSWDDEGEKVKMAEWVSVANFGKIKSNVLGWGLANEVPAFEKYAYDYCLNKTSCFIDERDGKVYRFVEIGEQIWMAKNLDYSGANGTTGVCHNNNIKNCEIYGRLYDWATAMNIDDKYNFMLLNETIERHKGICPSGWHLPSKDEWESLIMATGGFDTAGKHLRAREGWSNGSSTHEDTYNFTALPGGNFANGRFTGIGEFCDWWGSTEVSIEEMEVAYNLGLYYDVERIYHHPEYGRDKKSLFSIRCVKD
jgi:uncharacterized protein (TIGR02145 family)